MSITILKKRGGPGATTKPRPDHGFPPAEPVLFTPGRCFFIRRVSLSSFSCAFVVHFFLTFFFWLIVAFRFRMQLRPRPRRGSPLGGIARRGSVSAVTLLHAVRRRRLTRLIFDRKGGGITTTRKRRVFKMLLVRVGKNVVVGGPGRHAGRRGAGHHAGHYLRPAYSAAF